MDTADADRVESMYYSLGRVVAHVVQDLVSEEVYNAVRDSVDCPVDIAADQRVHRDLFNALGTAARLAEE